MNSVTSRPSNVRALAHVRIGAGLVVGSVLVVCAVLVLGSVLLVGCATSTKSVTSSSTNTAADATALWNAFRTPGPEHAVLAGKIGTWVVTVRNFAADGSVLSESQARSVVRWVMDGRYVEETTTGNASGDEFRGQGFTGFDNLKRRYVWTWIDNFGTGVTTGEGTYDAATKTFETFSQTPDFAAGRYQRTRNTEVEVDRDRRVVRAYSQGDEGEFVAMELLYTRAR